MKKLSDVIDFSVTNKEHFCTFFGITPERAEEILHKIVAAAQASADEEVKYPTDTLRLWYNIKDLEFTQNELAYIIFKLGAVAAQVIDTK